MRLLKGIKIAVILKIILVTITLTVLGFLMQASLLAGDIQIGIFFGISMILIALVYFTKISIPLKFFLPGILLLVTFVVTPVIYTISMSGYQYRTGNVLSKPEALKMLQKNDAYAQVPGEKQFDLKLGWCDEKYGDAKDVPNAPVCALVSYYPEDIYFLSTATTFTPLSKDRITFNKLGVPSDVTIVGAKYTWEPFYEDEFATFDKTVASTRFKYNQPDTFMRAEGYSVMAVYAARIVYDAKADSFTDIKTGFVYKDNGRGNYANTKDAADIKYPGWREVIGLENFVDLVNNPSVREPLIAVFIWTIIFAVTTVITQYALGLLIALTLNLKIKGRWLYRSIIILPYAMPSIMSILIWGGMLNTDFGAINNLIGLVVGHPVNLNWLGEPTLAKASVLLVNLWLGFPYFYLISSGALQAIPQELTEAASIDGASGGQAFRKITFPLLQQMLAPLLIASFAFNFNNFNLIYLLTGGGPKDTLAGDSAGATDILISYTYNLAFNSGGTQNFGLASAVSIVIFVTVAAISLYGIKRSKVLESFV
jgi:arabinogalactan oligomer/maltooligosaccharide transport system permease protein